jgi:hypothetical protein
MDGSDPKEMHRAREDLTAVARGNKWLADVLVQP